jgi:hypothetical protein
VHDAYEVFVPLDLEMPFTVDIEGLVCVSKHNSLNMSHAYDIRIRTFVFHFTILHREKFRCVWIVPRSENEFIPAIYLFEHINANRIQQVIRFYTWQTVLDEPFSYSMHRCGAACDNATEWRECKLIS